MSETALTLYIDLEQGSRIDLETAARAAIAWSQLIKEVGNHIDPMGHWSVEFDSALPGSQKIRAIIKNPTSKESKTAIISAVVSALWFITLSAGAWGVGKVLDYLTSNDAPPEVTSMSEEDKRDIAERVVKLLQGDVGRDETTEVFKELEKDDSVTAVGVTSTPDKRPDILIPRSKFPSAALDVGKPEKTRRTSRNQIELTLVRPILSNETTRRWGFQSQYGNFGAEIHDQEFLDALAAGALNVPLAQGIRMLVEIEIVEEHDDGVWRTVERSVKRVLRIIPPPKQESFDLERPQKH